MYLDDRQELPKASNEILKSQMDFKIIYLLTDFSDHARNAANYAIETFGTEVQYVLINSYIVRTSAATLIDIEDIAHQESIQNLEEEEKVIREKFPNIKLEAISKYGTPVDVINFLLDELPADLVVVGSKGISRLDEILIGSVTTAIMRGVHLPVLSVPIKAKFEKMNQIVLASDLQNANKPTVIDTMGGLKKHFGAHVSAATVKLNTKELTDDEQRLLTELEKIKALDEISVLHEEDISKGLMDYCDKIDADLLVVVAKHTSFFKRFFHKSITKELVNHEILPILVLEDN